MIRFEIKVQANARKEAIEIISDSKMKVKIRTPAIEGRANERLRELLSDYFKVAKSKVQIVKGGKSKNKIVEVDVDET